MSSIILAAFLQLSILLCPSRGCSSAPPTPAPVREISPTLVITTELKDVPKFLSLPFPPDPNMALLQGWFYDHGGLQQGIDYYRYPTRGTNDTTNAFSRFPVVAAADGYACGEQDPSDAGTVLYTAAQTSTHCVRGYGHRVFIRHHVRGATYYTYYGHLESIAAGIPLGDRANTVLVKRGQIIGYAGNTGTGGGNIHLHFGLLRGNGEWLDPYDIRSTHEDYPDPNMRNGLLSGINDYWTTNPPSYAVTDMWLPEGSVTAPSPNTTVSGTITTSGWATVRNSQINKIEIWIDGTLYRTAAYGLPDAEAGGNYGFIWEWDTTSFPNGTHTLQVQAVAVNGSRSLLPARPGSYETAFVLTIQNSLGYIDTPIGGSMLHGATPISGWAKSDGSQIERVEIWIDGTLRGQADYGLERQDAGGTYGFRWVWDTTRDRNGEHMVEVRAIAANGASATLVHGDGIPGTTLSVLVDNVRSLPVGKWVVR